AANSRLMAPTAWVDVMPTGLSSTIQPWTSRFIALTAGSARGGRGSSTLAIGAPAKIALHRRRAQQVLDAFRLVEAIVDPEPDLGRELQIDLTRDDAPQIALVALERLEHLRLVASAERHHIDGGKPQIGRHAHFRDRDQMPGEHRVMHVAARQQLCQRMADQLADAKLPLTWLLH